MLLRNWAYALTLVFILGVIARQPWPVAFTVAVAIVLTITVQWRRHALDLVHYTRRWVYRRGFPGEHLDVRITVENRKILPVSWLRIVDTWPRAVGPADETILSPSHMEEMGELVNIYSLRWRQRIERLYQLTLRQRGIYLIGPADLTSGDLFGMYEISQTTAEVDQVVVFPELLPINSLQLPVQDPFGERRSLRRLFEDPIQTMAIRPYQPEDGFRQIHWAATARTGELQVKVYQPVSTRVLMVCLNASTQAMYWLGVDTDRLEHMIKIAATLAYQGIQNGYAVGLLSNGCLAHSDQPFHLPPARSTTHLSHLLTALAAVTPFTTAPFETYLTHSMPKIPYGASLVVISAVSSPTLCASLMQVNRYRASTTLLSLDSDPTPTIPGIRVIHMDTPSP
jgi:uncharacterized protein (DUF58 family)